MGLIMATDRTHEAFVNTINNVIKEVAKNRGVTVAQVVAEARDYVARVQKEEEERQQRLSMSEIP